ncbi:hypothetical protein CNR22_07585 [Sphingobacteriaceae bacterium]|nr:hypothetical protein CNR22_07585 [Sphingobacteriaceae bacterium]
MKLKLAFLFTIYLLALDNLHSQNTISFSYNAGGGLSERKLLVVPGQGAKFNYSGQTADTTFLDEIKVFPNPASTHVTIEGPIPANSKSGEIKLINATGQFIKSDNYEGQSKNISVGDLANGIYIMEIKFSDKERKSYKIIVAK